MNYKCFLNGKLAIYDPINQLVAPVSRAYRFIEVLEEGPIGAIDITGKQLEIKWWPVAPWDQIEYLLEDIVKYGL